MFDIGFFELCLVGIVALLVVGPERLPRLARSLGMWVGRARRFMSEVKADINAEISKQDLDSLREIRNDLTQAKRDIEDTGAQFRQKLNDDDLTGEIQRTGADSASAAATTSTQQQSAARPRAAARSGTKRKTSVRRSKPATRGAGRKKTTTKKRATKSAGKK